jgi:DNA mismatch endonuclease (patch repair protein)
MTDVFSKEKRSWIMSRIHSTGTKIERIMENWLKKQGIRFEKHPKDIIGTPDFVIREQNIAIFCDSEWWHGHDWKKRRKEIHTRKLFWINKIERNMKRDKKVNRLLRKEGWTVLRFWGNDINRNCEGCVKTIIDAMERSPTS